MAIAYRSSSSNTNFPGTTPLVVNKPTGTASGDILVAVVNSSTAYATSSGWTQRATLTSAFAPSRITVLTLVAGGSEPASYSFAAAGGTIQAAAISAYSGGDNASPIDGTVTTAEDSDLDGVVILPSITTTVNNSIIVGCIAPSDGSAAYVGTAPPGSMTERIDINTTAAYAVEMADQAITPAGATGTRSFTVTATPGGTITLGALIGLKNSSGTSATVSAVPGTATGTGGVPSTKLTARPVAVAATASGAAIAPTIKAGQRVTAVPATASAQAIAPTVGVRATVAGVSATATAAFAIPSVSAVRNPVVLAVSATASGAALAPSATGKANTGAVSATANGVALAPLVSATQTVSIATVSAAATSAAGVPSIGIATTVIGVSATASMESPAASVTASGLFVVPSAQATASSDVPFIGVAFPARRWDGKVVIADRSSQIGGSITTPDRVTGAATVPTRITGRVSQI